MRLLNFGYSILNFAGATQGREEVKILNFEF